MPTIKLYKFAYVGYVCERARHKCLLIYPFFIRFIRYSSSS